MSGALYVCTIICLTVAGLFILSGTKNRRKLRFFCKVIASLSFWVLGFLCAFQVQPNHHFALPIWWILGGLCCGVVGDIFLGLRSRYPAWTDPFFLWGMAAFALGHVFYLIMIFQLGGFTLLHALLLLLIFTIICLARKAAGLSFGSKTTAITIYISLISAISAFAIANEIIIPDRQHLRLAFAAVFFTLSDCLLALVYFGKRKYKYLHPASSAAYYAAQILFALSILTL